MSNLINDDLPAHGNDDDDEDYENVARANDDILFGAVDHSIVSPDRDDERPGADVEEGAAAKKDYNDEDEDGFLNSDDDDDGEDYDDDDESAAIIQDIDGTSSPSKKKRVQPPQGRCRYCCTYLLWLSCVFIKTTAILVTIAAVAGAAVTIYYQKMHNDKLEGENSDLMAQIDDLETEVDQLKNGILDADAAAAKAPFVPTPLTCAPLRQSLELEEEGDSVMEMMTAGSYGCVANNAATTLLHAQNLILSWDNGAYVDGTDAQTSALASLTPSWIERRIPYYGIWIYPRLKLVLLSCPQCGNSESRTMLTVLSAMRPSEPTPSGGEGGNEGEEKEDAIDWSQLMNDEHGVWQRENDHSLQLVGNFGLNNGDVTDTSSPPSASTGMNGGDAATLAAFQLVEELLARDDWSSLAIVNHPYERFISGYAHVESEWAKLLHDASPNSNPESKSLLNGRAFASMEAGSTDRLKAWWSDVVLNQLYTTDAASQCAVPIQDLYRILPISSGYWRDGSGSGSYYATDYVIRIDQIHDVWTTLLDEWGFDSTDSTLTELALLHLGGDNSGGDDEEGYGAAARILLYTDDKFRKSVDAFYGQDFDCFGFTRGRAALTGDADASLAFVAETEGPSGVPSVMPSGKPTLSPQVLPGRHHGHHSSGNETVGEHGEDVDVPGPDFGDGP